MADCTSPFRQPLNRALTREESDLVRWLIEHSFEKDSARLLPQLESLNVVSKCNCGYPTIDFALDCKADAPKCERFISDWLADVGGMPVYVQLWISRDDQICCLEVGSLPAADKPFGLPAIESIRGY